MGDLHYPGLEGDGDAGAPRGQLDLHQTPDAIADLQGLIAHVLTLKGALSHSEGLNMSDNNEVTYLLTTYIVLAHLGRDAITGTLHILNSVLDLIGCRDVLPGSQECFLLHGSCFLL